MGDVLQSHRGPVDPTVVTPWDRVGEGGEMLGGVTYSHVFYSRHQPDVVDVVHDVLRVKCLLDISTETLRSVLSSLLHA